MTTRSSNKPTNDASCMECRKLMWKVLTDIWIVKPNITVWSSFLINDVFDTSLLSYLLSGCWWVPVSLCSTGVGIPLREVVWKRLLLDKVKCHKRSLTSKFKSEMNMLDMLIHMGTIQICEHYREERVLYLVERKHTICGREQQISG